ncbi:D-alanyl-D-alanine carboxypeptidase/D-alanyl-D-alanine-endopeptidase [Demequina activiva]|uniref:Peptidase S13 (D-alanyl-D-alanine carboxypeptidase) n=1 Tax=Demequina activiva TaxID=1582364 RepID=A0A919UJG8_9MICO|nr:D-alanyl-D-alanine carboxypeptidase [Demequina activiva]GIG53755.1 peptidase S13 (D-alanyl-D-alanine carboxypeptidase [Demequina activiva]
MRGKVLAGILVPAVVIVGAGGYAWADAQDIVPGWITAAPVPVAPAPFLTAVPVEPSPAPASAVSLVTADAPVPSASVVQSLAAEVRADERTGESTNVSVVDALTGEVYADVDAAEVQVPASTTKVLTAVGAVADLGPDHRMTTAVTWDPSGRVLTLVAGGDMLLAADAGHGGAGEDANGWAGMGDLARDVVETLGDGVSGEVELRVDDSAFAGPAVNPDWPQYALDLGYVAPASGLAVNIARMTDEHYAQRFDDPSLAAGDVLASRLSEAGLSVGEPERGVSPASAVEVAAVQGAPLSEVAYLLLRDSDNTIAEIVGRVHALETGRATTPTGAAAATIAGLASIGAPVDGLVLNDGAGFSEDNRIAPAHLTGAIVAGLAAEPTEDLLDWLPVGGLEGTVASRYADTDAAGALRAKTGSLTGVTALAGTVQTADGRLLAFAVLADGMPYGQERPRAAMDELVLALAGCGCEG